MNINFIGYITTIEKRKLANILQFITGNAVVAMLNSQCQVTLILFLSYVPFAVN